MEGNQDQEIRYSVLSLKKKFLILNKMEASYCEMSITRPILSWKN